MMQPVIYALSTAPIDQHHTKNKTPDNATQVILFTPPKSYLQNRITTLSPSQDTHIRLFNLACNL
jgi:hypothetical protein